METHWDRTWRRFNEAIEQKRRRDMNETRRDELREQVGGELVTVYAIGHNREVADLSDTADRIIALVTAARDAEIREALLSDEAVMHLMAQFHQVLPEREQIEEHLEHAYEGEQCYEGEAMNMYFGMKAALNAIGLGDGTGGRG